MRRTYWLAISSPPSLVRHSSKSVSTRIGQPLAYSLIEFQFVPLPDTNPVLIGHRWKEYHEALGLKSIVDFSWKTVLKEKPDLIHLLDFPYNGETRRDQLLTEKLTPNKYHLYVDIGLVLKEIVLTG